MPISSNIFRKYPNSIFIETGSHVGNGIQSAVEAGFNRIISIELSSKYHEICKQRFSNNSDVELVLGDVELVLKDIIDKIQSPITFWLDGHHSGDDTAWGLHNDPIFEELDIISTHQIKTHTLIIDDLRGIDKDKLIKKVLKINKDYVITYEDGYIPNDILVASII